MSSPGSATAALIERALTQCAPYKRWRKSSETAELSQTPPGPETAGDANSRSGERERSNGPAVTTPELSKDSGVCRRRSSSFRFGPDLGKLSAQL